MDFNDNKSISSQVEDYCRMMIRTGGWTRESRIPSTKDLAVRLGVNPRTVMKVYDILADAGLIYQKRGMGYYVTGCAAEQIDKTRKQEFMKKRLPEFAALIRELGIDLETVLAELKRLTSDDKTS